MELKAFLASFSRATEKFMIAACESRNCRLCMMESEESLLDELEAFAPDLIFLQAMVMENSNGELIARIRESDRLGKAFIVVFSSDEDCRDEFGCFSPDAILNFPFTEEQIDAVFRIVAGHEKLLLLVCRDEQKRLTEAFGKAGIRTCRVHSVDEGIVRVSELLPDIVVCCSRTVGGELSEFCGVVKAEMHPRSIQVVVLAESDTAEEIEGFLSAGADEIIVRPFTDAASVERVVEMVRPSIDPRQFNALVIDDSPATRSHISRMLLNSGFNVTSAGNGIEALKIIDTASPDIITCDYEMPMMDGWTFCKCLKGNSKYRHIPVIMISGRGDEIDKAKGRWLGIDAYLVKPFDEAELKRKVADLLKESMSRKTMKVLEKFVSSDAITSALAPSTDEASRAVEKEIVILFCDICSFTALCETMSILEVQSMVNSFYDKMAECLYDNHGIIDKFIGDAVVARFDSGGRAVDAFNAANAALEMIEAMKVFKSEFGRDVSIRIGINSGNVILGKFGSERVRMDFTMIGDPVNTAQRIESAAPANGCLLAEQVCSLISDGFQCGPTFEISVKNKEAPVRVNQLFGWWN